jgi:hypothetical protein
MKANLVLQIGISLIFKRICIFSSKNKKEATVYLNKVVNSKEYGSQAKYYLGFIAYEGDDYKEATNTLMKFQERKNTKKSFHYQADMNFKLGNFKKLLI